MTSEQEVSFILATENQGLSVAPGQSAVAPQHNWGLKHGDRSGAQKEIKPKLGVNHFGSRKER